MVRTHFRLSASSLFGALLLAACGGEPAEDTPPTIEETSPTIEITPAEPAAPRSGVSDRLGGFETPVTGLAVWQHPTLSYESTILAANGDAGLFMIPLDQTAPVPTAGTYGPVDVTYTPDGAIVAAVMPTAGAISLFAVDPGDQVLVPFAQIPLDTPVTALCFGESPSVNDLSMLLINSNGGSQWLARTATEEDVSVASIAVDLPPAKDCASTAGQAYILSEAGQVQKVTAEESDLPPSPLASVRDLAIVHTEDGPMPIYLLTDGRLQIGEKTVDLDDGEINAAPLDAIRFVVGSGNYGGVYRNGVVAFITRDQDLVLIPWLAIANALDLPTQTISPQGETAGTGTELFGARRQLEDDGTDLTTPPSFEAPDVEAPDADQ